MNQRPNACSFIALALPLLQGTERVFQALLPKEAIRALNLVGWTRLDHLCHLCHLCRRAAKASRAS